MIPFSRHSQPLSLLPPRRSHILETRRQLIERPRRPELHEPRIDRRVLRRCPARSLQRLARPAWLPSGRHLIYEAVSEGSWDLWSATTEGKSSRRLTSFSGNERCPVLSADAAFVYFNRDHKSIWRLPIDSEGRATGPPSLWAHFPKMILEDDSLALSKEHAIFALTEEASDLWLIEFPER